MADIIREVLRDVDSRSYLQPFLQCSTRCDQRSFEELRPISVVAGTHSAWAAGSSTARSGPSIAVCAAAAQVGELPPGAEGARGDVEFTCSISPSCGLQYDRIKDPKCYLVEAALEDIFIRGGAIDRSSLVIPQFGRAYKLSLHVTFLSVAGNMIDIAVLAVRGALLDVKLPVVIGVNADLISVSCSDHLRVQLQRDPVCVTVGVVDNKHLLCDPSEEELKVCSGLLTAAFDEKEKICFFDLGPVAPLSGELAHSPGISEDLRKEGLSLCKRKVRQIRESLLAVQTVS